MHTGSVKAYSDSIRHILTRSTWVNSGTTAQPKIILRIKLIEGILMNAFPRNSRQVFHHDEDISIRYHLMMSMEPFPGSR